MSGLYNLLELGRSDDYKVNMQITNAFRFCVINNQLSWTIDESFCDNRVTPAMLGKLKRGQVISTQSIMRVFEDGPKYLSMNARQFEALENTDLTLPIADYQQPFPVVCFPIPENYAKDRFIELFDKVRIPKYAIIWHRPDMILVTIIYARDFIWATFMISAYEGHTFEEKFEDITVGEKISGTVMDLQILKRICRACLNGALVFDQVKTTHFTTRSGKKPKKTDATYYSFDQSVRLYSKEGSDSDSQGGGESVRSHWRRGHWRMQAHGVGMGLRKRIRIAPVLVRCDLFVGELPNAQVTYDRP